MSNAIDRREIQRLEVLRTPDLPIQITIVPSDSKGAALITTKKQSNGQFSIQIDGHQWYWFTPSQRDLLFWHEVARIQGRTIAGSSWEMIVITIGLAAALLELPSHSVLSVAVALTVSGLAVYQLYQRHRGEKSLRASTAADQTAIALAMQHGYDFAEAHRSLYEALRMLAQQPTQSLYKRRYNVRLQVLEMLAAKGEMA